MERFKGKTTNMMSFGEKLKQLRTQAGMTQEELAKRIGVSKSVISYYELGERAPSPEVLLSFAKIFRTSTDYLLGHEKHTGIDTSDLTPEDIRLLTTMAEHLRNKNTRRN